MFYKIRRPEAMFKYSSNHGNGLLRFLILDGGRTLTNLPGGFIQAEDERRPVLRFQVVKRNQNQSMRMELRLHALFLDSDPFFAHPTVYPGASFPLCLSWRTEVMSESTSSKVFRAKG